MSSLALSFLAHFPAEQRSWICGLFQGVVRPGVCVAGVLTRVGTEIRNRSDRNEGPPEQRRELERLRSLIVAVPEGALALALEALQEAQARPTAPEAVAEVRNRNAPPEDIAHGKPSLCQGARPAPSVGQSKRLEFQSTLGAQPLPPTTRQLERLQVLGYSGSWPRTRLEASEQIRRLEAERGGERYGAAEKVAYVQMRTPTVRQLKYLLHLGYRGGEVTDRYQASLLIGQLLEARTRSR